MADNKVILVGTVGQGVMRSGDAGETWQRVGINQGLHSDALGPDVNQSPHPARVPVGRDRQGSLPQ